MNMDFYMPTQLITGKGCMKENAALLKKYGSRCLIVSGKNSARCCGALDDVCNALREQGIAWSHFDQIGQNPLLTDCMHAAETASLQRAEFIIGIGGGSALDAAKCTAVLAANPGMTQEVLYSLNWPNKPLPIIAVGTTAGTGSEVTKVSVITNLEGRKKSFHHTDVFPAISFGDPSYTMSLPEKVTKSTAVDALAHCAESYFSRKANDISKAFAVKGIRILKEQARLINGSWENISYEIREQLYFASIYGGLAINVTGTAMPHAVGYLLTEQHGLAHGIACAVFLPAFYQHNKKEMPELTRAFFEETGLCEESYLALIKELMPAFTLSITEEEIVREHSRWIDNGSIKKSWGEITADDVDQILRNLN